MNRHIRQATQEDAALLARLNHSVQHTHHKLNPDRYKDNRPDEPGVIAEFERRLQTEEDLIYIVEVDGAAVGYASCKYTIPGENPYVQAAPRLHIDQAGVEEEFRGKGIGTALVAHVEEVARERGIDSVTLGVYGRNQDALRLYERLGFTIESVRMIKNLP